MSIEWDVDGAPLDEPALRLAVATGQAVRVRSGAHQGAVGRIASLVTVSGRRAVELVVRRLEPAVGPRARLLHNGDLVTLSIDEIELFP